MSMKNRILLIDDDKLTLSITSLILEKRGYVVKRHECVEGIYDAIEKFEPHLIILDARLPDGDGRKVCQEIKLNKSLQHIQVIMCSGLMDIMESFNQQGPPDGVIPKPFDMDQFLSLIHNKLPLAA